MTATTQNLLTVRNRWAHGLGEGFSSQSLRDLAHIMEWTDDAFHWEARLVDATLHAVGELAYAVEDGMLEASDEFDVPSL